MPSHPFAGGRIRNIDGGERVKDITRHPAFRNAAASGAKLYDEAVDGYFARHKVKPGITGWAQVNGLRGETDTIDKMKARVEYDLEYLRNWSLALDWKIILRTIPAVIGGRGAH